jgi:hypothetical protein
VRNKPFLVHLSPSVAVNPLDIEPGSFVTATSTKQGFFGQAKTRTHSGLVTRVSRVYGTEEAFRVDLLEGGSFLINASEITSEYFQIVHLELGIKNQAFEALMARPARLDLDTPTNSGREHQTLQTA